MTLLTPSHNPWSKTCTRRLNGEPFRENEFCTVCDKDKLAFAFRQRDPLPICIYCWRPLVKFLAPASYKGPPSEWTHFSKLNDSMSMMTVLCRSKQHGPRVPRMIPGRLIIEEEELVLENALRDVL